MTYFTTIDSASTSKNRRSSGRVHPAETVDAQGGKPGRGPWRIRCAHGHPAPASNPATNALTSAMSKTPSVTRSAQAQL